MVSVSLAQEKAGKGTQEKQRLGRRWFRQEVGGGVMEGEGTAVLRKSERCMPGIYSKRCLVHLAGEEFIVLTHEPAENLLWGVQNLFQATCETRFKYSLSHS